MTRFPQVEVRASHGGHGVFVLEPVTAGTRILEFVGPRVGREEVERAAAAGMGDGFLQIGADEFYALSGGPDDFVNHSCAANTHIRCVDGQYFLVASRDIARGDELYFDYGITQIAFPFRFHCLCGAANCRGPIGNYDEVPVALMDDYLARGMVPPHVEAALHGDPV
ncbi:MAG: SET domain-containing protein-lysine N-methyltransferase [Proteobacteria bacterium]|jgi:SET domain-containing protein|nr:SET domain-containing protein-lysine N-methyltransferase [Pseudomonadota bacterium]